MKQHTIRFAAALGVAGGLAMVSPVAADTTITTFDDFVSNALYASWASPEAIIVSGPTDYSITATGYGSNWKYNPVDGSGNTNLVLTVTLSGPPAADGHLGPIVSLVDADGTYANYAWYGQTLGHHVLTAPVGSPTWIASPGTTPGLDLATLTHLHLQIDPGGFGTQGAYTIAWENLSLTGAPAPVIQLAPQAFNPVTQEFTLSWSSLPGKYYTVLYSASVNGSYDPLAFDIASGGASTTTTVVMPAGDAGFLRIMQQP